MKDTLICIPTYNEAQNAPALVAKIFAFLPEISVLVVDDNSPDGTAQLLQALQPQFPNLHVLNRAGSPKGFANSYKDGFCYALERGYEWILQMDSDFSHDPMQIRELLRAREPYDFVVGSRYVSGGKIENWPLKRRLLSWCGNAYARSWLQLGLSDLTGGFNLWRRAALQQLLIDTVKTDGYSFLIELKFRAVKAGLCGKEIPITFVDRVSAQSKMNADIFREAVLVVPALRLSRAAESLRHALRRQLPKRPESQETSVRL